MKAPGPAPRVVPALGQRGVTLLESLLALGLLALVVAGSMGALTTSHRASGVVFSQNTAENLARTQMEYVLSLPFQTPPSTYPPLPTPGGWTVTAEGRTVPGADMNLEEIWVTVSHQGRARLVLVTRRYWW